MIANPIGLVFGKLTVKASHKAASKHELWDCVCSCGREKTIRAGLVYRGKVESCGCDRPVSPDVSDYTNVRFGIVTAVERVNAASWRFRCDCGTERVVNASKLKSLLSCGCQHAEAARRKRLSHREGGSTESHRSGEYSVWGSMKTRCYNESAKSFRYYGARGIYVCRGWGTYEAFLASMGRRPSPSHTIDRINNDGSYTCGECDDCKARGVPLNCRWVTMLHQARNKRNSRFVTAFGQTKCVGEWAREIGLPPHVLYGRLNMGWSLEEERCRAPVKVRHAKIDTSATADD